MTSRLVSKAAWVAVLAIASSAYAWAQYGGGGGGTGGMGGTGTYNTTNHSYGNGAKIGAAVGGAAAGGLLIYALHRRHTRVVGCVTNDGKTLTADNGKKTYQLKGEPVTPGEHLAVSGKKSKGSTGIDEFDVASVKKSFGQCQQTAAMAKTP
jgi:hypothetical protein